jgi:hypothetical protein
MTSLRDQLKERAPWWALCLVCVIAVVTTKPAHAANGALDLLYERTVMTAADGRCRLFSPPVAAALNAARIQARGAALRAGTRQETLVATERKARSAAASTDCRSKDMSIAADRVRTGFDGYSKLARMDYPGEVAGWKADRAVSREGDRWKLSQSTAFGWDRLQFGLAGQYGAPALTAVAVFADGASPYSARLVMRDTARTSTPYLDRRERGMGGKLTLAARTPPRSASRVFTAEWRGAASPMLLSGDAKSGWSFRFPKAAAAAMADLDPREAVIVEFVFGGRKGEVVRQAHIEVGDFAAGQAFLAASWR